MRNGCVAHGPRSSTSCRSSAGWGTPGTSWWCGTSPSSAAGSASTARAGGRPPTPRSVTRSASPTSTRCRWGCCSSDSFPRRGDGPPDIDVDIESERREEIIQYVYERYGRRHAAQVANVITYRPRSAVRDVAKALGHAPEEIDGWASGIDHSHHRGPSSMAPAVDAMPPLVAELAVEILDRPRHLGIHSAGMVICDRPVVEVCPVEWARREGRTVLQWDKDDCAAIGLVKFDLLGLGMLEAVHRTVDLIREHQGIEVDLAHLPQEEAVYDLLCAADTVGVFQVESRAQMATLPRRPAALLLRPGGGGGADQAGSHSGAGGQSLHPSPAWSRAGHLPPSIARAHLAADSRSTALPRAADGDGGSHRRVQRGRGGRTAPGHGGQALGGTHGAAAPAALRRHGHQGRHRGSGRRGVPGAGRLRQLRVPRVALGLLRPPRVLVELAEGAPPGGVHRRPLEFTAHGVLVPPEPGGRRAAPRRGGAPAPCRPQRGGCDPRVAGAGIEPALRLGLAGVRGVGRAAPSASWPAVGGTGPRTWCAGPG